MPVGGGPERRLVADAAALAGPVWTPDGSAVAAWMELANDQAAFKFRRIEQNGQRSAAVTVADMGANRNSGHPRMVLRGGELVFAWTGTDDSLRVQTATARIQ